MQFLVGKELIFMNNQFQVWCFWNGSEIFNLVLYACIAEYSTDILAELFGISTIFNWMASEILNISEEMKNRETGKNRINHINIEHSEITSSPNNEFLPLTLLSRYLES